MVRNFSLLFVLLILTAGLGSASTINSFHIELGSWDGASFNPDGSDWNTFNPNNWAVGATAAGTTTPLLDSFNNVNLPDGQYFLYMATFNDPGATAIRITLGYAGGPVAEVYTSPSVMNPGAYQLVSGSGFTASLLSGPQTTFTAVGSQQVYAQTGESNWIIYLDSTSTSAPSGGAPEPGTYLLFGTGLAGLAFIGRKRQK